MKTVAEIATTLFAVSIASCADPLDDGATEPTSTTTSALTSCPKLVDATTSEFWSTDNGAADLWPTGCGITTTNVFIRKGADIDGGAAFLASVVWNDSVVGHVYWIPVGSLGLDFHTTLVQTHSARTNNQPTFSYGEGGGPDGGNPLSPGHPHVDGYLLDPTFVADLKGFSTRLTTTLQTATIDLDPKQASVSAQK
jgi:hypothetical protein